MQTMNTSYAHQMPHVGAQNHAGAMMGSNGMMMMMRILMQLMMMMMGMGGMGQQGAYSPSMNPNFGNQGGCCCNGGTPGYNDFSGGYNGNHNYGPGATQQLGPVGSLGQGQGADAARWALGMEGISESRNPGTVRAISNGNWQPWCADFVSQAYRNSPGGSPFGHQSSVAGILGWGTSNNRFFNAGSAARGPGMLRPGDIAVWKSGGKSHVGLVTGVNPDGTFNTVEGNAGNAVRRRTHGYGRGLTGFVRPRGNMPGQ